MQACARCTCTISRNTRMRIVDFHASLYNLTQMERHQEESNKVPLMYQIRSGEIEAQEKALRQARTNEVENPHEQQRTDSEKGYREFRRRRRRRQPGQQRDSTNNEDDSEGHIIDIDA